MTCARHARPHGSLVPDSAHMDEVVEAARASRDLATTVCDLLSERRRGFLHSTAVAFVDALRRPFPFFRDDVVRAPLSGQVSSEDWDETLRDLHLVADMLASHMQVLGGAMVRLLINAIHRTHPDLAAAASEARDRAIEDVTLKAKRLLDWERRIEDHADELAGREGLESSIREVSVSLDDLRRELGL